MGSFLQQELLGGGQEPATADPRIGQAVHTVSVRDRLLTGDEVADAATRLSDAFIERQAQEITAAPGLDAADRLTQLAESHGQVPDAAQALAATISAMGVTEEPERRTALAERANRLKVESEHNRQQALARMRETTEGLHEERFQQSEVAGGTGVLDAAANAAVYTNRTAVEWLDNYLLPGFYAEVVNIAKDVAPELVGAVDYLQPEATRRAVTQMILDLPPEKSKELVDKIFASAHQRAGRLLSENRLAEAHLVQEFLAPLEGESKYNLSNFFAPLDYLIGAAQIKGAASGLKATAEATKFLFKFPKGSIPWTLSDYQQGAANLIKATTSANAEAATAAMGTNPASVVGQLVLPKPRIRIVGEEVIGHGPKGPVTVPRIRVMGEAPQPEVLAPPLPHGKPFLDEWFMSPAAKDAKAAQIQQGLKDTFQLRLNDSVVEPTAQGMNAFMRIGSGNGLGWAKAADAELWASRNLNVPYTVERDLTGGYQVQAQHFYPYELDDVGTFLKPVANFFGIGKGAKFAEFIARGSTQAELIANKALAINRKIAKAFTGLGKAGNERVQETLLRGEREGAEYSTQQLVDMGLSDKEIAGYHSIRLLSRKALSLKDANARQSLMAAGYRQTLSVDGSEAIVKLVDPANLKPGELINNSVRAVDVTTGQRVKLANLDLSQHKLYRFFEDTKSGYSYGVVPKNATPTLRDLPVNVLKPVSGWMPRYYNAPYFIREVMEDGLTRAVMTARSRKAADEAIAQLKRDNPNTNYGTYEADAIAAETGTIADIAMLREQGLLYSSHRRPLALMDAEGGEHMLSVADSIQRLVSSTSMSEGLGRWTLAMKHMFDNTYGRALGFTMDLARTPVAPRDVAKQELFREAMAVYNYVRLVNGLDAAGPVGQFVRGYRNKVADLFYNFGHGKGGTKVGNVSQWFGDNISGLNPTVIRNLKSAAFQAYIGLSPLVQGPLQMTMVPTYAGVRHALPYMASGKFFTDAMILQFANDTLKLDTLRRKLGLSGRYVESLLNDYRGSGLQQMVDNHITIAGTLGDSRVATAGAVRKGFANVFNASKSVGFDVGVSVDKRAAWLVMRNRALKDGSKLDEIGLKKITQDAEHLTGSLNRSDPLYSTDGAMSLWLQFMSHPIKMVGRLVRAGTGGKEVGLSAAETRNVALAGLLSYGFAGYGITELVERMNAKNNWQLPDKVKLTLQEGLLGYTVNSMIRLADEDGDASKVMFSGKYSPFSQAGTLLTNAKEIGKLLLGMRWDQLQDFVPNPAAFGFTGAMADAVHFYYRLAGGTSLSLSEDAKLSTMANFVRKFPITNNWLKYHMALNLGYKFDSRGRAIVEATKGEAIASLFGMKSYAEYAQQRANLELYGDYETVDGEALTNRIKEAARDTANWLLPTLTAMGNGEISSDDAAKLIEDHNITFSTGLEPVEYAAYRDELVKLVLNSQEVKSDRLVEQLAKKLSSGEIAPTASLRDKLYGLEFPGKDEIIPAIERMFNEVKVQDAE